MPTTDQTTAVAWPYDKLGNRFVWGAGSAVIDRGQLYISARLHDLLREEPAIVKVFSGMGAGPPELSEILPSLWRTEARSLMRLRATDHPGIVRVLAADYDKQEDAYFVAWEDYYYATLRDLLRNPVQNTSFRTLSDCIEGACLLAGALLEMHSIGIVHRDIRPDTICVWDKERRLALSQFGQSIFLNALLHTGLRQRLPVGLQPIMLPYIAPERCAYLFHSTDPRGVGEGLQSDIYSLGITLCEWFVGTLPPVDFLAETSYQPEKHAAWVHSLQDSIGRMHRTQDQLAATKLRDLLREMVAFDIRERSRSAGDVADKWVELRDMLRRRRLATEQRANLKLVTSEKEALSHMAQVVDAETNETEKAGGDEMQFRALRRILTTDLTRDSVRVIPGPSGQDKCLLVGGRFTYECEPFRDKYTGRVLDHVLWIDCVRLGLPREYSADAGIEISLPELQVLSLLDHTADDHLDHFKAGGDPTDGWSALLREIREVTGQPLMSGEDRGRRVAVEALRALLDARRSEVAVKTYAYRLVDAPAVRAADVLAPSAASQSGTLSAGAGAMAHYWIEADDEAQEQQFGRNPDFAALEEELRARPPLSNFMRELASDPVGKPEVLLAADLSDLRRETASLLLVDPESDEELGQKISSPPGRVRLTALGGTLPIPSRGWLRPRNAQYADRQERVAIDRLAEDSFKIDSLIEPARVAARVFEELRVVGVDARFSKSKVLCLRDAVSTFPMFILKGPPGTGKTHTVGALVEHIFRDNPAARILVCSQAHRPLDNLLRRIRDLFGEVTTIRLPTGEYEADERTRDLLPGAVNRALVRETLDAIAVTRRCVGAWSRDFGVAEPQLVARLNAWEALLQEQPLLLWPYIIRGAGIVGASCVGAGQLTKEEDLAAFDWVIVEEAARAHATELLVPLTLGNRWFLLGDHDQLGPFRLKEILRIVQLKLAVRKGEEETAFDAEYRALLLKRVEWFGKLFGSLYAHGRSDQHGEILECYRMHPILTNLVGSLFYHDKNWESRLAPLVSEDERVHPYTAAVLGGPEWLAGRALVVLDTSSYPGRREDAAAGFSKWNPLEVELVKRLVGGLWQQILDRLGGAPGNDSAQRLEDELAVLTVYAEQRRRLVNALGAIDHRASSLVNTVTSFQGREANVVILSLVRSNEFERPYAAIGTISHDEDLNVALSRAREALIVVGDISHFRNFAGGFPSLSGLLKRLGDQEAVHIPTDILEREWRWVPPAKR